MSWIDDDKLLEDYVSACRYPGAVDVAMVETSLREYLRVIGADRRVIRLESLRHLGDHPPLEQQVHEIIRCAGSDPGSIRECRKAMVARNTLLDHDALDVLLRDGTPASKAFDTFLETNACDALFASDAHIVTDALDICSDRFLRHLLRPTSYSGYDADRRIAAFANWHAQFAGDNRERGELYRLAYAYIAAVQNSAHEIIAWSRPLFSAFVSGCWMLHWAADAVYWIAKPTVHVERTSHGPRLHCTTGPAMESDLGSLYFWHGVMVAPHVIEQPGTITVTEIEHEENVDVCRVLLERYGADRYLRESGAQAVQHDASGLLYRKDLPDDEPLVMVRVLNATPEPDGALSREEAIAIFGDTAHAAIKAPADSRFKEYMLRVPPYFRTAHQAVAWTFGFEADAYQPLLES